MNAPEPHDDDAELIALGAELMRAAAVAATASDDDDDAAMERVSEITRAIRAIPPRGAPGLLVWLRATAAELRLLDGIDGPIGPMNWDQKVVRLLIDQVATMGTAMVGSKTDHSADDLPAAETPIDRVTRFIDDRMDRLARGEVTAWDIVCKMEDDVAAVSEFATVFMIMASGEDLEGDVAAAFNRIAWTLKATGQRLAEARNELFHMLHPCPEADLSVAETVAPDR